ncbi:MAG TPA: hypothetical protein PLJ38_06090, partial [bacterium]|nr:hypothetical protein [bacterium]
MAKYKIDNDIIDVPENEINEFLYTARKQNISPIKQIQFNIDNNIVDVPENELKDFFHEAKKQKIKPELTNSTEILPANERNRYNQIFGIKTPEIKLNKDIKENINKILKNKDNLTKSEFSIYPEEKKITQQEFYTAEINKNLPSIKKSIDKNYEALLKLDDLKKSGKYKIELIEIQENLVKENIKSLNNLQNKFNQVLKSFEDEKNIKSAISEDVRFLKDINELKAVGLELGASLIGLAGNIVGGNIKDEKRKKSFDELYGIVGIKPEKIYELSEKLSAKSEELAGLYSEYGRNDLSNILEEFRRSYKSINQSVSRQLSILEIGGGDEKKISESIKKLENLQQTDPIKSNNFLIDKIVLPVTNLAASMIPGAALSLIPIPGLSTSFWTLQGADEVYSSLIDTNVDKNTALTVGLIAGVPYALSENIEFNLLKGLFKSNITDTTKKLIQKKLIDTAFSTAVNASQEGLQRFITETPRMIVDVMNNDLTISQGLKNILADSTKEFLSTLTPMGIISGVGSAVGTIKSLKDNKTLNNIENNFESFNVNEIKKAKDFIFKQINKLDENKSDDIKVSKLLNTYIEKLDGLIGLNDKSEEVILKNRLNNILGKIDEKQITEISNKKTEDYIKNLDNNKLLDNYFNLKSAIEKESDENLTKNTKEFLDKLENEIKKRNINIEEITPIEAETTAEPLINYIDTETAITKLD